MTNDNGGTAVVSDFTLSATGTTSFSGAGGSNAINNQLVVPGSYTLAETQVNGYTASSWSCTDGTLNGDTLALVGGDNATCTITNDDQPAQLIIIKNLIKDSGGTAVVGDFSGSISGTATFDGGQTWTGTATPGQTKDMTAAGTYDVTETAVAGYTTTYSADCSGHDRHRRDQDLHRHQRRPAPPS